MIGDALELYKLARDSIDDSLIKTSLFNFEGDLIAGSDEIILEKSRYKNVAEPHVFFRVKSIEGYEFLRVPANPSGVKEEIMHSEGDLPDAEWFRYIPNTKALFIAPNVKTNFTIIGYPYRLLFKIQKQRPR